MEPSLPLVSVIAYSAAMVVHTSLYSTASPSTIVRVTMYILPEFTPRWDKQPFGNQMITDVASLLESGNKWECKFLF